VAGLSISEKKGGGRGFEKGASSETPRRGSGTARSLPEGLEGRRKNLRMRAAGKAFDDRKGIEGVGQRIKKPGATGKGTATRVAGRNLKRADKKERRDL